MKKIEGIIDLKKENDIYIAVKGRIEKEDNLEADEIYCKRMYEKYKEKMFQYVKGEYVIVIKDKDTVIMARDKIGAEQLYYSMQKDKLYYSTQFKFFLNDSSISKEIRKDILQQFLTYEYIAAPDTILKNIYKIEPGTFIIWKDNKMKKVKYYNILKRYKKISKRKEKEFKTCKKNLQEKLEEKIEKSVCKDKIYGSYLSGGIDSSLVTGIASKYTKYPIKTFSIGFKDDDFDEAKYAKEIAKYFKCEHHELYIDQEDMIKTIKKIPYIYDEPFADTSQIPTIILNELAKGKVDEVITGDGADQIFCGSTVYDKLGKLKIKEKIARYSEVIQFDSKKREKRIRCLILDAKKKKLYKMKNYGIRKKRIARMLLETQKFLPDRLLNKVLKSSDENGIDLIKPFSDYTIIEESYKIPLKYKYFNGEKKYILKEIVYDLIPKEYLDRPKHGFGVPIEKWLTTEPMYSELLRVANKEVIEKQGIFEFEKIKQFIENFKEEKRKGDAIILWSFYVFQIWYKTYMG